MAEKTILFTTNQTYGTVPPVYYTAGQVVTLREDVANRWLSRGVATDDAEAIAAARAAARAAKKAAEQPAAPTAPSADPTKPDLAKPAA